MSQWADPTAEPAIVALSVDLVYLLLGFYGWEYIQSLEVEYAVIRGRLSFRWPLIPYIVGRTSLLVFLVLLAIWTSPFSVGNILCLPSIVLTSLSGNIALGCSSTIFVIRTWLIWKDSRWVHVLLSLLSLGQWAMFVFDPTTLKTTNVNGICQVYFGYPQMSAIILIYTAGYDLLVFVLSIVGLSRRRSESPLKSRLRAQGIVYLAVAVIAYIPPMVFALLDDFALMVMFSDIAIATSTITSSRAVRSLLFLDISKTCGQMMPAESDMASTTQIMIHQSVTHESMIPSGQLYSVDEADKC